MSSAITTNVRLLDTLNDPQFQSLYRVVDDGDEMWSSAEHYTNVGLSAPSGENEQSVRSNPNRVYGANRTSRTIA